jgi:hypothetical protein
MLAMINVSQTMLTVIVIATTDAPSLGIYHGGC